MPAPLISSFVEDQHVIFGPALQPLDSPFPRTEITAPAMSTDFRSPRKQMFSDLPTPGYHQTSFQPSGSSYGADTGMMPLQPSYGNYHMAPQGEGGYGSLNDALRSPTIYNLASSSQPTPREAKLKHRESAMMMLSSGAGPQHKPSMSRLREREEGQSF